MFKVYAAPISIRENFSPAKIFPNFGSLFSDIIVVLISIAGIIFVIITIVAGIKIITASGDTKKLQGAWTTILYAIIGLAVTVLAFVILQVIQYFLRSNVPIN